MICTQTERHIFDRFASMEARPEMWAGTREAFGLQIVVLVEMLLWSEKDPPSGATAELMKRLFGPGPVVSTEPIEPAWARQAVATARGFVEEKRPKPPTKPETNVRYTATGPGHDAYDALISALGGPCKPEIVGWCDVDIDGSPRSALVVTQAWPFLPLGTDPAPIKKAKKYVALIPESRKFRTVEVSWPLVEEKP